MQAKGTMKAFTTESPKAAGKEVSESLNFEKLSSRQLLRRAQQEEGQEPQAPETTASNNDIENDADEGNTNSEKAVNFVFTEAPLLSGDSCNSTVDASACEGGVAAVSAFIRHDVTSTGEPVLVLPKLIKTTKFTQSHPLQWSVNRLVLQGVMNWNVFMSTPSLLLQHKRDGESTRDLSQLQNEDFPLLLTNANLPPSNSWASGGRHEHVHFDHDTRIALISIADSSEPLNYDQIESAHGALYTIADENRNVGAHCVPDNALDGKVPLKEAYKELYAHGAATVADEDSTPTTTEVPSNNTTAATVRNGSGSNGDDCWLPVIVYYDNDLSRFQNFIRGVMKHPHPPAVILETSGLALSEYSTPKQVPFNDIDGVSSTTVWIHSYLLQDDVYTRHRISKRSNSGSVGPPATVTNLEVFTKNLDELPEEYEDETYNYHIDTLYQLNQEAELNDRVVGVATEMPPQRLNAGTYRRCNGGECEMGNLFADAIRWKAKADVAFVTSGGLRGGGWQAGSVQESDIWTGLPFPNTLCRGVMNGVSLFEVLDYSIKTADFSARETNEADRLLQVSGLRIIFNTDIPQGSSRIIAVDVWKDESQSWEPLSPVGLYSFASDSYVCGAYDPYPTLLVDSLAGQGEEPGMIGEDYIVQAVVAEYLGQLNEPYDTNLDGRLVNNTETDAPVLDFSLGEDQCEGQTYWSRTEGLCVECPSVSYVGLSEESLEFQYQLEGDYNSTSIVPEDEIQKQLVLRNREKAGFAISPNNVPSWLEFWNPTEESTLGLFGGDGAAFISDGSSLPVGLRAEASHLNPGKYTATLLFNVKANATKEDMLGIQSCNEFLGDLTVDVSLRVFPASEMNQLGNIRWLGLALMMIVWFTAAGFAYFVYRHRKTRIISTMQPAFLITICFGVSLAAATLLPLSLDDGVVSSKGCSIGCMTSMWLINTGVVILFSALFSKLWRINRLMEAASTLRRMKVSEKDVIGPFAILFSLNAVLLTAWTIVDPLKWKRLQVAGKEWETYGVCRSEKGHGAVFASLLVATNIIALVMACYQAYKSRKVSSEFSECRPLGYALFSWFEVLLIGFPSYFLVPDTGFSARFFLEIALLFALCMAMLLLIFIPLVLNIREYQRNPHANDRPGSVVSVTGIPLPKGSYISTEMNASARYSGSNGSPLPNTVLNTPVPNTSTAMGISSGRDSNARKFAEEATIPEGSPTSLAGEPDTSSTEPELKDSSQEYSNGA